MTPRLGDDAQVQCLAYLMRCIYEIVAVPDGVLFDLIPIQYTGGPYTGIGLYTEESVDTDENLCRLSLAIEARLEEYVKHIGLPELLELSSAEEIRWQDVLQSR